jgi:CheY-like chemotaxis protein
MTFQETSPAPTAASEKPAVETILVVDDDPDVLDLARYTLVARGYSVVSARDGLEAVSLFPDEKSPFDLVVSDVQMPQMNGLELAERLWSAYPLMKVLFISGFVGEEFVESKLANGKSAFLGKPFRPRELAKKVREMLDR